MEMTLALVWSDILICLICVAFNHEHMVSLVFSLCGIFIKARTLESKSHFLAISSVPLKTTDTLNHSTVNNRKLKERDALQF